MTRPKEQAYDDLISPHIKEVIRLCREHKINTAIYFALDEFPEGGTMQCRTVQLNDDKDTLGVSMLVAIHKAINDTMNVDELPEPPPEGETN